MTRLWQVVLILLASTTSCERGFSTQNHTTFFYFLRKILEEVFCATHTALK
jgi:hypothetical protein